MAHLDPLSFPEGLVGISKASSSSSSSASKAKANRELTKEEEVTHADLVWGAKLKEVESQVKHKSFEIKLRAHLGFRPGHGGKMGVDVETAWCG